MSSVTSSTIFSHPSTLKSVMINYYRLLIYKSLSAGQRPNPPSIITISSALTDSVLCLCPVHTAGVHITHPHHRRSAVGHSDWTVLWRLGINQRPGSYALLLSAEHLLQEGKTSPWSLPSSLWQSWGSTSWYQSTAPGCSVFIKYG